jgi:hypothetical protein
MRSHDIEFKERKLRYFDPYDVGHFTTFTDAVAEGRICVAIGPTGIGKTTFFDFACASCLESENHNLMAYQHRYGCENPSDSVNRVMGIAKTLRPNERLTVAFYPKTEKAATQTGGDTWHETQSAISILLERLSADNIHDRLVGIELSVERDFDAIYKDVRRLSVARKWCLIEFREWDKQMKHGYMQFLMGMGSRNAEPTPAPYGSPAAGSPSGEA